MPCDCTTPSSRPNNIRGGLKRPSVCTSVRPPSDINEIWYAGRDRCLMHDGMPYDAIQGQGQGQGQGTSEVAKIALFQVCHLTMAAGK